MYCASGREPLQRQNQLQVWSGGPGAAGPPFAAVSLVLKCVSYRHFNSATKNLDNQTSRPVYGMEFHSIKFTGRCLGREDGTTDFR